MNKGGHLRDFGVAVSHQSCLYKTIAYFSHQIHDTENVLASRMFGALENVVSERKLLYLVQPKKAGKREEFGNGFAHLKRWIQWNLDILTQVPCLRSKCVGCIEILDCLLYVSDRFGGGSDSKSFFNLNVVRLLKMEVTRERSLQRPGDCYQDQDHRHRCCSDHWPGKLSKGGFITEQTPRGDSPDNWSNNPSPCLKMLN